MTSPTLQPIAGSPKIPTQVIQGIASAIAAGQFKPGDRLPSEAVISAQMGVGLSSVREALATLQGLGVVSVRHGAGRVVQGLTYAAVADPRISPVLLDGAMAMNVYEVRLAIEIAAIRQAAERRTDSDLRAIEDASRAMARVVEQGELGVEEDGLIHRAIARASGNVLFVWLGDSLANIVGETRQRGLSHPGRPELAVAQHFELLEAIRTRDPDSAEATLRRHLRFQHDDALELMDEAERRGGGHDLLGQTAPITKEGNT